MAIIDTLVSYRHEVLQQTEKRIGDSNRLFRDDDNIMMSIFNC